MPQQPPLLPASQAFAVDCEHAGEHATNVSVENRLGATERYAGDRAGGVPADTGQLGELSRIVGQSSAVSIGHLPRPGVKRSGPAVIAETAPRTQHLVLRGTGQGRGVREALEESLEVRNDRRHPGLLEHDLGDPDRVRIVRASPREVPSVFPVPTEQRRAEPA